MGSKSSSLTGSVKHKGNINMLTPRQDKYLRATLKDLGGPSRRSFKDFLAEPESPDMYSRKELDKGLKPTSQFYTGLLDQKNPLNQYLDPAQSAYQKLLKPRDTAGEFQKGVVDPLMQQYTQQILPAIQQRFVDQNAGSSSALNQALGQSGKELGTQLGAQYLPYLQGQQQTQLGAAQGISGLSNPLLGYQQNQIGAAQNLAALTNPQLQYAGLQQQGYNQAQTNRLSALSGLSGLAGQSTFTPMVHQQPGILGALISAQGEAAKGAAVAVSSETIKENIHDYEGGLDKINNLKVKQYDYIESFGGAKNKVGLIAEKVPIEIQAQVNDLNGMSVLGVDVYGLVSILVNAVKELSDKVDRLEKVCHSQ